MSAIIDLLKSNKKPLLLSHRGNWENLPENTIAAFQSGIQQGAQGIELDIRLSKDDEIIVYHDAKLGRLTDRKNSVRQLSSQRISSLPFSSHPEQGYRIPTLASVFDHFGRDIYYNIEIKYARSGYRALIHRLSELVREYQLSDNIWFSSFDFNCMLAVKSELPDIPVAYLFEYWNYLVKRRAMDERIDILHPGIRIVKKIAKFTDIGKPICFWTVNSAMEMRRLDIQKISGIISDNVPQIKKYLYEF